MVEIEGVASHETGGFCCCGRTTQCNPFVFCIVFLFWFYCISFVFVLYFSCIFIARHLYFFSGQLHLNCTAVVFVLCGSCICIVWELYLYCVGVE